MLTFGVSAFKTGVKAVKEVDIGLLTHHLDTNTPGKFESIVTM